MRCLPARVGWQADEDIALGLKEEEEEEDEPEPVAKEEEESSDSDFGFKKPVKAEEDVKRKAAVKSKAKAKAQAVSERPGRRASGSRPGEAQKMQDSSQLLLSSLKSISPLQMWNASEKQAADVDNKVGKALKLFGAMDAMDGNEELKSMAAELKTVADEVSWCAFVLSEVKRHAGTDVFEIPEEIVADLVGLPSQDVVAILTDIGNQIIDARFYKQVAVQEWQ